MNDLNKKAWSGIVKFIVSLAALLFVPAWTLDYW